MKLGEALIQDLGLTDGLRSAAAAVDDIGAAIDDVRPAIRYAADLGKTAFAVYADGARVVRSAFVVAGSVIGARLPQLREWDAVGRDVMAAASNGMRQLATAAAVAERVLPAVARATIPEWKAMNGLIDTGRQKLRDLALVQLDPLKFGDTLFIGAAVVAGVVGGLMDDLEMVGDVIDDFVVRPFWRAKNLVEDTAIAVGVMAKALRESSANPIQFAVDVANAKGLGGWVAQEVALATPVRKPPPVRPKRLVGWLAGQPVPPLNHREELMRGVAVAHAAVRPELVKMNVEIGRAGLDPIRNLGVMILEKAIPGVRLLGLSATRVAADVGRMRVQPETPAHLRELATRLNDPKGDFVDPVAKFRREAADIRDAMTLPNPERFTDNSTNTGLAALLGAAGAAPRVPTLVPEDVGKRALVDVFRKFVDDATRVRPPEPAEFGSREAADLVIRSMGGQSTDPADLIRQEIAKLEMIRQAVEKQANAMMQFLGSPTAKIGG